MKRRRKQAQAAIQPVPSIAPQPQTNELVLYELLRAAVVRFGYPVDGGVGVAVKLLEPQQQTELRFDERADGFVLVTLRAKPPEPTASEAPVTQEKYDALLKRVDALTEALAAALRAREPEAVALTAREPEDPEEAEFDEQVERGRL